MWQIINSLSQFIRIYFLQTYSYLIFQQIKMRKSIHHSKQQQKQILQQEADNQQQQTEKSIKKRKLNENIQQSNQHQVHKKINDQDQTCIICTSPYNLNRKLPVIACSNKHTFCLNCIVLSIQNHKPNCPICREQMEPLQKNQNLYQMVLNEYKRKNQHLQNFQLEKQNNHLVKLTIGKFSKKHSSLDHFQIPPRQGRIIKKTNNKQPSLLIFDPQFQDKSIKSFKFCYIPQKNVQISFGICAYDKFLCKVVENCGFDTKIIDFFVKDKKDKHKQMNKNNIKQEGIEILVRVDLEHYEIHWFQQRSEQQNDKNESKQNHKQNNKFSNKQSFNLITTQPIQLNNKVGDISYYPYCVLYNTGDEIVLNK